MFSLTQTRWILLCRAEEKSARKYFFAPVHTHQQLLACWILHVLSNGHTRCGDKGHMRATVDGKNAILLWKEEKCHLSRWSSTEAQLTRHKITWVYWMAAMNRHSIALVSKSKKESGSTQVHKSYKSHQIQSIICSKWSLFFCCLSACLLANIAAAVETFCFVLIKSANGEDKRAQPTAV